MITQIFDIILASLDFMANEQMDYDRVCISTTMLFSDCKSVVIVAALSFSLA